MRIAYPKRSKFLKPCEDAIRKNKKFLLARFPILIKLSPQGYNGKFHVNIDKNSNSFKVDWKNPDPTRFPVRVKAAAYALYKMGFYGSFIISHETGILTIQPISLSLDNKNNSKECVEPIDLQKKDDIEKSPSELLTVYKKFEPEGGSKDIRVKFLLEFGKTINPRELFPVLHDDAALLIGKNPFAFALAAALDRGTRAEIIWTIPYYLQKEIGELKPAFFVDEDINEIKKIIQKLPIKPRYVNDAPRTIKELSEIVVNEFNGDASKIWKNKSAEEVKTTFQRVHGVGPGISSMIVLLLERCFGIHFNDLDHRNMNVKPDIHIIRVFGRLGFISQPNEKEVLEAARKFNPEYPGAIDAPVWVIGRKWCTADTPQCIHCPVNEVCPKNITFNNLNENGGVD